MTVAGCTSDGDDVGLGTAGRADVTEVVDAPATVTLHTGPFSDVSAMAADPIAFDPTRAKSSARLVLVDAIELEWQRARYREGHHLFASADPVLVGLNTLQQWLWNRIGSPATNSEIVSA